MKLITVLAAILLCAGPVLAATYSWVDDNGTVNFTEDYSSIPKKYRKKVIKRGDISAQPVVSPAASDVSGDKNRTGQQPQTSGGGAEPATAVKGLYGGHEAEWWQQEFRRRGAEYKQLEQQLVELETLMKKPVGISKERAFALPQEFKEKQKQYNESLKRYNDLNDEANKAGLPGEFRN